MEKQRNIGLDLIRILAMVLVWINHSGVFALGLNPRVMEFGGVAALEIFFALSGFLVGKSMIRAVTADQPGRPVKKFFVNRFLRTVPLYYLVLLYLGVSSGTQIPLSNFLFLQNFNPEELGFFPPSWSLSVEVWFYFLIPPVFLGLFRLFSRKADQKTAVYRAIAVLCLLPFILRSAHILLNDPAWDYGVRKQIPLRLDALMIGVFFAAMKLYEPEKYRKAASSPLSLLIPVAGILGLYGWYCMHLVGQSESANAAAGPAVLFTVLPVLSSVLVIWLENTAVFAWMRGTVLEKAVCGLSNLSYAAYLVHLSVFVAVYPYFINARFIVTWAGFLLAAVLTLLISFAAYKLVEEPLARLKDKVTAKM